MATEFITARFPEAEMPRTSNRAGMLRRTRFFLKPADQGRIREAGTSKYGRWRDTEQVMQVVKDRTARMGVGPKLIVQRRSADNDEISIREITKDPLIPELHANPLVEKIHAIVWAKFDVRSGGLYVCRRIDGSTQVSKHGYIGITDGKSWRGAAEDVFVLSGGMTELENVAEFIVVQTKAGNAKAATVIVNRKIWTPSQGWHAYTGEQHFHVHFDCLGGTACNP
jgi:hypothetical protein